VTILLLLRRSRILIKSKSIRLMSSLMMIVLSQLKKGKKESFWRTSMISQEVVRRRNSNSPKKTSIGSTMRFTRLPRVVMSLSFRLFLTRLILLVMISLTTCLRLSVTLLL